MISQKAVETLWSAAKTTEAKDEVIEYCVTHNLFPDFVAKATKKQAEPDKDDDSLKGLYSLAYGDTSSDYGNTHQQKKVVNFAKEHNQLQHLPEHAHSHLHEMNIPHSHERGDDPHHVHQVKKAVTLLKGFTLSKAWATDNGTVFEGWVSTNAKDLQKDIVEPEAFVGCIKGYMQRFGPLSSNHNIRSLPIGHLQKIAVIRNGKIIAEESHPVDNAEFEHFTKKGSGVYARGIVTSQAEFEAMAKGNIGGMSWIGDAKEWEELPDGGKRVLVIEPLMETTLAAYPVNTSANITSVGSADYKTSIGN